MSLAAHGLLSPTAFRATCDLGTWKGHSWDIKRLLNPGVTNLRSKAGHPPHAPMWPFLVNPLHHCTLSFTHKIRGFGENVSEDLPQAKILRLTSVTSKIQNETQRKMYHKTGMCWKQENERWRHESAFS